MREAPTRQSRFIDWRFNGYYEYWDWRQRPLALVCLLVGLLVAAASIPFDMCQNPGEFIGITAMGGLTSYSIAGVLPCLQ